MPLVTRQANQGNLFKQTVEPPNWENGDLWSDISTAPPILKINDNGTATEIGTLLINGQTVGTALLAAA